MSQNSISVISVKIYLVTLDNGLIIFEAERPDAKPSILFEYCWKAENWAPQIVWVLLDDDKWYYTGHDLNYDLSIVFSKLEEWPELEDTIKEACLNELRKL